MITLTAKLPVDEELSPYLERRTTLHQKVLRQLFVAIYIKGQDPNQAYVQFAARYGLFDGEINSLRKTTEAIYSSWKEGLPWRMGQQQTRIEQLQEKLKQAPTGTKAHQWKRKLHRYQQRWERWQAELASGKPQICFGSRKLFQAQFQLPANGYPSRRAWKADWQAARSDGLYLAGRSREHTGNAACLLEIQQVNDDGLDVILQLRKQNDEIAGCRAKPGDYLPIPVRFTYQHNYLLQALEEKRPISYRFLRDGNHWKVQAMVDLPLVPIVTDAKHGSIGVDLNPLCITACSLKPDGNALVALAVRKRPSVIEAGF